METLISTDRVAIFVRYAALEVKGVSFSGGHGPGIIGNFLCSIHETISRGKETLWTELLSDRISSLIERNEADVGSERCAVDLDELILCRNNSKF
jgi:hypothetical protein